jgi:CheY-like chemotaxis protein
MDAKKKIVIVDDDPDIVEQLTVLLQAQGYEVHAAGNQAEGEELLLGVRPDLAILDLMMEHMDSGFVLCHHLKKLYPETPVILLTGVTAATGMSFAAPSAEAQSWVKAEKILDKPVRPEQVTAAVRRLLREPAAPPKTGGHA